MVRPIPAVGLASALVQIIDFSINTLRKDNLIAQPSDPAAKPIENAEFLQDLIDNFYRLTDLIDQSELKKLHGGKAADKKGKKLSEAAQTLLKLVDLTKELTNHLIDSLISAQSRLSYGDPRRATAREALMNGVMKKSDVTGAKKKFRVLRREVDTALLLAMRQYLDQSAETGLPVFSGEDSATMHHWEKWQNSALDAIHAGDWKANKKKNLEEFSKHVDKLLVDEHEAYFCEAVFKLLWFDELDERVNSIAKPLDGSFEYLFGKMGMEVGGLLEWFANNRGEGLYWITGKPGSGKTALMKHIFRNPRIFSSLEAWSGHTPGITSGFFFWNAGLELQKTPVGLIRSILYESLQDMIYGPLEQNKGIIQWLFVDRWSQFTSFGGGLHDFTFTELRRGYELMISDVSKKFLFLVDGLDEMDEYSNELMDMILASAKKDNVKYCVSSRASPVFQSAFETRPRMVMDEYTKVDILSYVTSAFNLDARLQALRGKLDEETERHIVGALADKASGVFLLAVIATDFVLSSIREGDDFLILKDRVDALPYQFDDFLAHVLHQISPADLQALWQLHTLIEIHPYPHLLPLSFALTAETSATLAADVRPLKPGESAKRIEDMRSLLTFRCKTFFSIFNIASPEQQSSALDIPTQLRVTYHHRTLRDYFLSQPAVFERLSPDLKRLNAHQQWANAYLWTLKTLQPPTASDDEPPMTIWDPLSHALQAAPSIFTELKKYPLTYTDAALSTAIFLHLHSSTGSDLPCFSGAPTTSLLTSLDLAVFLNLQTYVAIKAKTADRKDIRHAIDFSTAMRKRLGPGGEAKWLDGIERQKLRSEFNKVRTEVDGLLEYYAKAMRFATAKPFVEVPEYV